MKKYIISAAVIVAFVLYGIHQQQEATAAQQAVADATSIPLTTSTPTPTSSVSATASSSPSAVPTATPMMSMMGKYKDGSYTGVAADAFYGNIQVKAVISGGKITDVIFLQSPNDRGTSISINAQAMPRLKQEAIAAQSANVNGVSGATDSSQAFVESLTSALKQAS